MSSESWLITAQEWIEFFGVDGSSFCQDQSVYQDAGNIEGCDYTCEDDPHQRTAAACKELHGIEYKYFHGDKADVEKCKAEDEAFFLKCVREKTERKA